MVDLTLLAVIALLAALAISNRLAATLYALPSTPEIAPPEPPPPPDRDAPDRWASAAIERNLFNSDPPEPEPEIPLAEVDPEPEPPPELPGPRDPCERADGDMKLLATMVADPEDESFAVVQEGRSRRADRRLVMPGSRVDDGVVAAIYRRRAVIWQEDHFGCVELGKEPPRRRRTATRARARARSRTGFDPDMVKKLGQNRYAIDRAALDEQLNDLGKLGRQIRIRPHTQRGRNLGFKLLRVSRNSLFDSIGLRRNDVLTAINGEDLDSPSKALQLFEKLDQSRNVEVKIQRRGKPVVLEYEIR